MERCKQARRGGQGQHVGAVLVLLAGLTGLGVSVAAEWSGRPLEPLILPDAAWFSDRLCHTAIRGEQSDPGRFPQQWLHRVQHCSTSSLGAPQNLTADGTSTSQITVTWQAGTGTVHHYEVWRSRAVESLLITTTTNTTYTDQSLPANTSYLYRVRAVDGTGAVSPFSTASLGTTVLFPEAITQFQTTVKAQHVNELRPAINAVRSCAGLSAFAWGADLGAGQVILANHVQQLRDQLKPALVALGLPSTWIDDPLVAQSTAIKKVHIQDLRDAVR